MLVNVSCKIHLHKSKQFTLILPCFFLSLIFYLNKISFKKNQFNDNCTTSVYCIAKNKQLTKSFWAGQKYNLILNTRRNLCTFSFASMGQDQYFKRWALIRTPPISFHNPPSLAFILSSDTFPRRGARQEMPARCKRAPSRWHKRLPSCALCHYKWARKDSILPHHLSDMESAQFA